MFYYPNRRYYPRFEKDLALKASENKFKALVEQSLTGIYIFEEDKYIYVNSQFCEIFGYSENEIITGMKPTDVISFEDKKRANENINKRLNGEVQSVRYIAKGNHKTGKPLWVEIHGTHLVIEGKDVITGTVLDITARKIAEEEIRKLNGELEEKVKNRTNELETKISEIQRMNKLFVGRELRIKELKEKIKEIENSQKNKTNN
ncbi:MAG: PAS domain S-box protein [Draconibacterium sp.]|nr:PAS domain S-box protein [Draconibacterium sp.]